VGRIVEILSLLDPVNHQLKATFLSIMDTTSRVRRPLASASMHSRSSARFFTPRTTVSIPSMERAYRWAREAGDSPNSLLNFLKGSALL